MAFSAVVDSQLPIANGGEIPHRSAISKSLSIMMRPPPISFSLISARPFISTLLAVLAIVACSAKELMQWEEVTVLPPSEGELIQPGVAGAFAGVSGEALLVAGGANFPKGLPWEGGPKVWWDTVFVLERKVTETSMTYEWAEEQGKLPAAAAYGVSIPLDDGVLCIGGCDAKSCFSEVFSLRWDGSKRSVEVTDFPSLPRPLAFMAGSRVGDWVLVAGGQETMDPGKPTKNFFGLDLSQQSAGGDSFKWVELPSWEGPARILPVTGAIGDGFYLWSGRKPDPDGDTMLLRDAYKFETKAKKWSKISGIQVGDGEPRCVMAAASYSTPGDNGVFVFGGADGVIMEMLEHNGRKARSDNKREAEAFAKFNIALLQNHPGFSREVLAFDPSSSSWKRIGSFPEACPVTTTAVRWGEALFLPSGEVRPGVRSARIWKGTVVKKAEAVQ